MKTAIHTDKAPAAIGPYSQAVRVENLLFTSGQLPADPSTGLFPAGIEAQTRQSLANIKALLEEAGSSVEKVVKVNIFLADIQDFSAVNAVYASFFGDGPYPARSAVEVAGIPKNALIEIEAVAEV